MRHGLIARKARHRAGSRYLSSVWRQLGIILLPLVLLTVGFSAAPGLVLGKCDLVGYALCHRIPDHSLHFAGRQLPLCARCSGTYLGSLWGLLYLGVIKQRRAGRLPRASILALLVLFFIVQGVDGVNSFLSLFPTLPHLYEPRNYLRFVSGALNGLTIAGLVLPLFNSALWLAPDQVSSIRGWREVTVLLMGVGGLAALIPSQAPVLHFVLGPGSILSVILVLSMLNTTILAMVTGREGKALNWGQAWSPLFVGLNLSLLEIGTLILLRGLVTSWLDFPI